MMKNDPRDNLNPLIEKILSAQSVIDSGGRQRQIFPLSVKREEGMALYNLIKKTKPKHTLEIGMAYGVATLFICQAHRDNGQGHHTVIDPLQKCRWDSLGLSHMQQAGFDDLFTFHEAYSHEVLPQLLLQKKEFDFIFIDGSHRFDYALLDFFYSDMLLKVGGYLMFHDLWMPSIRKVVQFVLRNRHYRICPEFTWKPYPLWKRLLVFFRDILQTPFDLHAILFSLTKLMKKLPNYCLLNKVSIDDRKWRLYRSF